MKRYLLFTALLAACGPPEPASAPAETTQAADRASQQEAGVPIAAAVRDAGALQTAAHRLAGLVKDAEAGYVWTRHAEAMDEIWGRVEERHLGPMRAWAESELELTDPAAPLFYPFSGPDLPSALQFFPAAGRIVLVGLEPPGRIPELDGVDAEGLAGEGLAGELERLRGGLENLAEAGYFVTKKMETDLVATRLEGILPVLYLFLARAELSLESVEFIRLDGDGAALPLEVATERTATAVRIRFDDGNGNASRELYYFSRDLSNSGLAAAPGFVAFLRRLGAFRVYLKSASYLLHMDDFTALKELLVTSAGTVLQDDSGIPLRDLAAGNWQRRFFGTYTRTLPTYREWFQEDLKAVYDQGGIPELPFAIGYHSKIGGSCLIWAERLGE